MPDLDRTFRSLDLLEPPDVSAGIVGRVAGPEPSLPGPSRGHRLAAVLVAIAVFALAVALGVRAMRTAPVDEPTPTPSPDGTDLGFAPGFTEIAEVSAGQGVAQAYGGGLFFGWGGQRGDGAPHQADGQVIDLLDGTSSPVAASPLSPRSDASVVWTGSEFVVWGGRDGEDWPPNGLPDGAAYEPATDTWRPIAPAPVEFQSPALVTVWTGTEMIVWGDWLAQEDPVGAAYDPATDTWRALSPAPIRFNDASAVWTGAEMVVFGARLGNGNRPQTPATGAAYEPATDTWRTLPDTDLSPNSTQIAWDGERIIAMDYGHEARVLDPSGTAWAPVGRLPANQCEGGLSGAATLDGMVVVPSCGELVGLEAGSDRWRVLKAWTEPGPALGYGGATTADGIVLLRGGEDSTTLFAYRPPAANDERRAWDVAAAYGALRSGYPYSPHQLPEGVEHEIDGLITSEAKGRYDDETSGLGPLWTYYYGFQVLRAERAGEAFEAVIRLEGPKGGAERLTIGPGTSADGATWDLVILDVEPGG
jgi:hypothetical protein